MRLSRWLSTLLLLGLGLATSLHAQTGAPSSPYSVTVPVADTSEAQRDEAFAQALGQVLARVAGGQDLRSATGYADALKRAPGLVQQYRYQRAGNGLELQAAFDPGAVQRLVGQLGVPPAGVKPPVLLVVRGPDGALLGQAALSALARQAAVRGYHVVYPDPARLPDLDSLQAADPSALAAITRQYHTGLILLGNLGVASADWTLLSGGQPLHWMSNRAPDDAALAAAADAMIARVGQQLNVIGAQSTESLLWVAHVDSAMDYANLLATLRSEPSVREVGTLGARDDGMLLRVKAALPASALAAALSAGGHLIQGQPHAGADASLRWLH